MMRTLCFYRAPRPAGPTTGEGKDGYYTCAVGRVEWEWYCRCERIFIPIIVPKAPLLGGGVG